MYTSNDITILGNTYRTKDGKFFSKTISSSWYLDSNKQKVEYNKGYSYWYDKDQRLGSTSYDYFFFTGKEGIEKAVEVLNRVL